MGSLGDAQVVVVMVPLPAQGHLNQLLQLSRLILSYNIPIHYVGAATHNRQARLRVQGWHPQVASNIHFHDFEIPPFLQPPPNPDSDVKFPSHLQPVFNATSHLCGPVSVLLRALSREASRVVVIHDSLTASVVQEVGFISNAESYTFQSSSAFCIYLYLKNLSGKAIEPSKLIPEEIPSLEGCFTEEFSDFIAAQYEYRKFSSGFLYNTCRSIESDYLDLLEKETTKQGLKHWGVGPLNPLTTLETRKSKGKHFCLEWLDKQAQDSVIYVSFGTTTTFTDDQIKELAIGLKQSQQKFIWVLRDADKGDVFSTLDEGRSCGLPDGYEEWVNGTGLVVRDWAPQLEILGHPATGGFMSHCGWNSCMESISMGVPIAAWPMHSDQPRNMVLITKLLKTGIAARDWAHRDKLVPSKDIAAAVRRLMESEEGNEMRKRSAKLGDIMRQSMDKEGISRRELESFIAHITR